MRRPWGFLPICADRKGKGKAAAAVPAVRAAADRRRPKRRGSNADEFFAPGRKGRDPTGQRRGGYEALSCQSWICGWHGGQRRLEARGKFDRNYQGFESGDQS